MFEVICFSPLDEVWEERDEMIVKAAGRSSDFSGAGCGQRDHGWVVSTFERAQELKKALDSIPAVHAIIREQTTHTKRKRLQ